ncbi:MAG TPA: tRNA-binding protein [Candidatus Paceibacterota bacterium]
MENNEIQYSDFEKVDIRVGKIIKVEDFPEARKLMYKFTVDFGPEVGIKISAGQFTKNYTKDELMGRLIIGCINLVPKKIGPFTSEFITLGLTDRDGNAVLLSPDKDVSLGERMY